jgi:Bacteriophage clamp loader A subunit
MNHFDFINDIRVDKKNLIEDNEQHYNAFMVNRGLSYYRDTVMYAQQMNLQAELPSRLQHDYLFFGVRKSSSYRVKWAKRQEDEDISTIMKYFGYSRAKAVESLNILNKEQIERIRAEMSE